MHLTMTLVYFIIILGILIFIHELGHFLFAKKLGVGVEKFSLGFGPKIFSVHRGETEYLVSAVPLGGYVKMSGDDPAEEGGDPDKSFSLKPIKSKLAIVAAGPGFNFLFAVLLFSVLHMIGIPVLTATVGEVMPDSAAMSAGIVEGDLIKAIDGRKVENWNDLRKMVVDKAGQNLTFTIQRENRIFDTDVVPQASESQNIFGETVQAGLIGVKSAGDVITQRSNPAVAIVKGAVWTGTATSLTVISIVKIIQGKLSPKNISGPIGIATIIGEKAEQGILSIISLMAFLSLSLGVINLAPIPILDGGHIMFFAIEAIIRKPFSLHQREVAQQVGMILLILLMVFVFSNDIRRIIGS